MQGSVVLMETFREDTHPDKDLPRVRFRLILARKARYYLVNIILPSLFVLSIALTGKYQRLIPGTLVKRLHCQIAHSKGIDVGLIKVSPFHVVGRKCLVESTKYGSLTRR